MEDWSTTYWLVGIALVALIFVGAWSIVRVLRARRPLPGTHADDERRRH